MNSVVTCNAFRVLSLAADARPREMYRQQQRIQNAIDLGDPASALLFTFLPSPPLGTEIVLDAVHRIENERLLEELFWVHDLGGQFDLKFKSADDVIPTLRTEAASNVSDDYRAIEQRIADTAASVNQIQSARQRSCLVVELDELRSRREELRDSNLARQAVAEHNLAVILTCLARELKGSRCLDYWNEALQYWSKALRSEAFWKFLEHRAEALSDNGRLPEIDELRVRASQIIRDTLMDEVWSAVASRDYRTVTVLTQILLKYDKLLNSQDGLTSLANKLINDGSVAIGEVLDRISAIDKGTDSNIARKALVAAEKNIRNIGHDFDVVLKALGPIAAVSGWDDARATALEKLSIAYFNILDDEDQALRLVIEGQTLACDPAVKDRLDQDWRHVQRALLCSEGIALGESRNYAAAQKKFAAALLLSTDEEKEEIAKLQETCQRAQVFREVDTTKRSPSLRTINGVGTTFVGRRDYDRQTNTYVTNHWFVILFLPIIPIASYRVSDAGGNSYHIYGCVPLSPFLKKYRWGVLAAVVLLLILANLDTSSRSALSTITPDNSPPSTRPTQQYSLPASSEALPSNADRKPASSSPPNSFSYSRSMEKQAIESERAELKRLSDSLDARKVQIEAEAAELERMEASMRTVKSTYTEQTVPEYIRKQYNETIDDYNNQVPSYNRDLQAYNADVQEYKQRINAFNTRVDRYNASR